ncbi:hypothetical protein [Planococcus sp. NCCP-2050]|uniref:hypothetical protein n=1 Tax=Planococcus sp. NCCP-2050 TaxID=2944679 RepID=UPI00203B71B8|nr:hypothetical protein [Planococcus sp. NCCP-2050]GKW45922.1 hypothetical protein NCCP2050_16140 [Planococcus sp. NCCP-2050]
MELQSIFSLVGLLAIMWWMLSVKRSLSEQVRQNQELIALIKDQKNHSSRKNRLESREESR